MVGSAAQRDFTQHWLKDDVHEVAVVDVQARVCSNLELELLVTPRFDVNRGRVTAGNHACTHAPRLLSLLPPTIWRHHRLH